MYPALWQIKKEVAWVCHTKGKETKGNVTLVGTYFQLGGPWNSRSIITTSCQFWIIILRCQFNDVRRFFLCQVILIALAWANYDWWDLCLDNELVGWWVALLIIQFYISGTWQDFIHFSGVGSAHTRFTYFEVIEDGKEIGIKVCGMLWVRHT